uniref:Uncharacterized protein n=1 Tax=Aegilops tauschii subsp. strangulata TaxID=200361 RepID=A0A453NLE0_AEGTS
MLLTNQTGIMKQRQNSYIVLQQKLQLLKEPFITKCSTRCARPRSPCSTDQLGKFGNNAFLGDMEIKVRGPN